MVALRCLANILLLESRTRQIFVDTGYASAAADLVRVLLINAYSFKLESDCSLGRLGRTVARFSNTLPTDIRYYT